jgi:hypothetical protein
LEETEVGQGIPPQPSSSFLIEGPGRPRQDQADRSSME